METYAIRPYLWSFAGRALVSCLTICQLLLTPALAQTKPMSEPIPIDWESYLERPDILKVQAKAAKLGESWEKIKKAQVAFVAQLLETYPKDTHIYFLARDSEHLYDVARLATKGTPDFARIHLLNISRLNMEDFHVMDYLAENGVSEKTLSAGQKALFVDTGFAGSIPNAISEKLSKKAQANFKTHLIVSETSLYPSSRTFLVHLSNEAAFGDPTELHSAIVDYEHLPRYTDRSSRYIYSGGKYHPISVKMANSGDGQVSKTRALQQMQDLAAEWKDPKVRTEFEFLRKEIRDLVQLATTGKPNTIINALAKKLENASEEKHRLAVAILKDVVDSAKNTSLKVKFDLEELKLDSNEEDFKKFLTDALVKVKYPHLANAIEYIDDVEELVKAKDAKALRTLLSLDIDENYKEEIKLAIFDSPKTGEMLALQKEIAEKSDLELRNRLFIGFARTYSMKQVGDIYKVLVQAADPVERNGIINNLFYEKSTADVKEKMKVLLEVGKESVLINIADAIVKRSDMSSFKDEVRFIIEQSAKIPNALKTVAYRVFPNVESSKWPDVIALFLEKADMEAKVNFAKYAHKDIYKTAEAQELVEQLIKSKNANALMILAHHVLPYSNQLKPLMRKYIETVPTNLVNAKEIAAELSINSEKDRGIFETALQISDLKKRKKYLDTNLPEEKAEVAPVKSEKAVSKKEKTTTTVVAAVKPVPKQLVAKAEAKANFQEISQNLKTGDFVVIENKVLKVLGTAGDGLRGIVFKVQDKNGYLYALKVARYQDAETLESIQKESRKAKKWAKLGIPHAEVLVQADDYVLKTWVDGELGDKVMERYFAGDASAKAAVRTLFEFIGSVREKGVYLGDFRPPNVMWYKNTWVIIDGGSMKTDMTIEEAHARWSEKFEKRWKIPFKPISPSNKCEKVFMKAG